MIGTAIDAADSGYCYHDLGAGETTIYGRIYIQYNSLLDVNNAQAYYIRFSNSDAGIGASISFAGLQRDGAGNYQWIIHAYVAGAWTNYTSGNITPQTGRWYLMEHELIVDGVNGEVHMWVDGDLVVTQAGIDTDDRGNMQKFLIEVFVDTNDQLAAHEAYIDCCVCADSYIGPEAADIIAAVGKRISRKPPPVIL